MTLKKNGFSESTISLQTNYHSMQIFSCISILWKITTIWVNVLCMSVSCLCNFEVWHAWTHVINKYCFLLLVVGWLCVVKVTLLGTHWGIIGSAGKNRPKNYWAKGKLVVFLFLWYSMQKALNPWKKTTRFYKLSVWRRIHWGGVFALLYQWSYYIVYTIWVSFCRTGKTSIICHFF